jgi:undecaprenyl-diphosphatase
VSGPGQQTQVAVRRSAGRGGRLRLAGPGWAFAGLACLALAAALIAVVAVVPSWVHPADQHWLRWMLDIRTSPGISAGRVLNVVAGGTVMWIVRVAIAVALAIWRRWRALAVFALAELCAELCIGPVKALVNRPRPGGSLVTVTGQSMPSGHALTASVTAVALALILTRPGRSRVLALLAAAAWAILVALSRTYLSAHWLTDVLAGLLLGTGWAALWFGALGTSQRTHRRDHRRERGGRRRGGAERRMHRLGAAGRRPGRAADPADRRAGGARLGPVA